MSKHTPNIYLDIDGVLLMDIGEAAPYANEFLSLVLDRYPDTTYWLTTHQWHGESNAIAHLAPYLKPEVAQRLHLIKDSEWGTWKTEGFDFTKPFLWFDDDLYTIERETLIKHNALDNHILVNFHKDPNQLSDFVRSFPVAI